MQNLSKREALGLLTVGLTGIALSACGASSEAENIKAKGQAEKDDATARNTDARTETINAANERFRQETDQTQAVFDATFDSRVWRDNLVEKTKGALAPVGLALGSMFVVVAGTYGIRRKMNEPKILKSEDKKTTTVTIFKPANLFQEMFGARGSETFIHQEGVPYFVRVGGEELSRGYETQGLTGEERKLLIEGDIEARRIAAGTPQNVVVVPREDARVGNVVPGEYKITNG